MLAGLGLWWQKIKRPLSVMVIIAFSVLLVVLFVVEIRLYGTGFAGKTLFEWLNLLGVLAVPVVAGFGVAWFTREQQLRDQEHEKLQRDRDQQLADQRAKSEQEAIDMRAQTERDIAQDNQRETALQAYLDKMSELLLKEHLGERTADGKLNPEYEHVRKIAQIRTITVLNQLDAKRVSYVFTFLREAGLMSTTSNDSAVSFSDASFVSVNWSQAFLFQANLSGAFLAEANLSGAKLRRANLTGAKLYGADLSGAILIGADLSGAILIGANLKDARGVTVKELEKQALSLKRATMPDGSKYETSFTWEEINSLLEEAGSPDKLNLSGRDLADIDLSGLNLSGANLSGAILWNADLNGTDLSGANLKGAHLGRANLKEANLNKAWVTREQLDRVESLEGATMPDGSIHP